MRVIAGEFRSRRLKTLAGRETRPTPDRLREALFNILAPRIEGKVFLDAYAGIGAVGIEALSRGARKAIFVERNRAAAAVIRDNIAELELAGASEVFTGKVLDVIGRVNAELVFLDPPYELNPEYAKALQIASVQEAELVMAQHSKREKLADEYGKLKRVRLLTQGDNSISFYERID